MPATAPWQGVFFQSLELMTGRHPGSVSCFQECIDVFGIEHGADEQRLGEGCDLGPSLGDDLVRPVLAFIEHTVTASSPAAT